MNEVEELQRIIFDGIKIHDDRPDADGDDYQEWLYKLTWWKCRAEAFIAPVLATLENGRS